MQLVVAQKTNVICMPAYLCGLTTCYDDGLSRYGLMTCVSVENDESETTDSDNELDSRRLAVIMGPAP